MLLYPFPSFQRRGGRAANKCREASLIARPAWFSTNREGYLILFEFDNHPVCAAKERDLLLRAQTPLLGKEGNVHLFNANPTSSAGTFLAPTATTMNCFPCDMNVIGRPVSLAGSSISSIVLPVFLSRARNFFPPPCGPD